MPPHRDDIVPPAINYTLKSPRRLTAAVLALAMTPPVVAHGQSTGRAAGYETLPSSRTYTDSEFTEAACNRTRQRLSEARIALRSECAYFDKDQLDIRNKQFDQVDAQMEVINSRRRALNCIDFDRLEQAAIERCRQLDHEYIELRKLANEIDNPVRRQVLHEQCTSSRYAILQMEETVMHCDAAAAQRQARDKLFKGLRGVADSLSSTLRGGGTPRGSGR